MNRTDKAAAYADLTKLVQNLQAAPKQVEKLAAQLVDDTASKIAQIAKTKAPIRTGELRDSITVDKQGPLTSVIGPKVEYGVFQEFGTASRGEFGGQPYDIFPKKAKLLAFKINGKMVYTKKVKHPGVRPKYYMRGAFETVLKPFADELAEIGALAIEKGKNAQA